MIENEIIKLKMKRTKNVDVNARNAFGPIRLTMTNVYGAYHETEPLLLLPFSYSHQFFSYVNIIRKCASDNGKNSFILCIFLLLLFCSSFFISHLRLLFECLRHSNFAPLASSSNSNWIWIDDFMHKYV